MKGDPVPEFTTTGPLPVSDELVDALARLLVALPDPPRKEGGPEFPGDNPAQ
jgi:hypothetical protein